MSWEEDFLVAVTVNEDKENKRKKSDLSGCIGCGCMVSLITITVVALLVGVLLIVL
jgi:hypothetical protein